MPESHPSPFGLYFTGKVSNNKVFQLEMQTATAERGTGTFLQQCVQSFFGFVFWFFLDSAPFWKKKSEEYVGFKWSRTRPNNREQFPLVDPAKASATLRIFMYGNTYLISIIQFQHKNSYNFNIRKILRFQMKIDDPYRQLQNNKIKEKIKSSLNFESKYLSEY